MEDAVRGELRKHFRPEFLNRVDETLIFDSLDEAELARIVDLQLVRVQKRLEAQQFGLVVDDAARKFLAREGYDPQFGARPLKRAIQEYLLNPLATQLLSGGFTPGDTIRVVVGPGESLEFSKG